MDIGPAEVRKAESGAADEEGSATGGDEAAGMSGVYAPYEQLRYAAALEWGTRAGFVMLAASFLAYVFGWLPAHVPPEQLAQLWTAPVGDYLRATGIPTGWGWTALVGKGDIANLLGIVVLSGASIPCLLAVMPFYATRRNRAYLAICVLEVLVLLLAASGILGAAH